MSILTQSTDAVADENVVRKILKMILEDDRYAKILNDLIAPMVLDRSVMNYALLVQALREAGTVIVCKTMTKILEKMDREFRRSEGRTERYYVKNTRNRTIVTMLGEVTYKRTEYIDRYTGKPFIYVDEEIGLDRRMRYDSTVAAEACEQYSNNNSMIKVGENLSKEIYGFSINPDRKLRNISRQQVFNMINRFKVITAQCGKVDETPDTIYIMADEKYVNLQQVRDTWAEEQISAGRNRDDVMQEPETKHFDEMVKMGVIFTGREELTKKNGERLKRPRWVLTGKWHIAYPFDSKHFWQHAYDTLNEIFDLEEVKNIYILGDGAQWIKAGTSELRSEATQCKFAMDRFHITKAIHKMTKDSAERNLLLNYAKNGMIDDFNCLVDMIVSQKKVSEKTIRSQTEYILNNIKGIATMKNEVKIGCAMEQAIQHVLASVFTSVPKAYASDHLKTYTTARMNHQNNMNMIEIYLKAVDASKDYRGDDEYDGTVHLSKDEFDWSIIDDNYPLPYSHLNFSTVSRKVA